MPIHIVNSFKLPNTIERKPAPARPLHTRGRKQIMFSGDTQLESLLRAARALNLSWVFFFSMKN